MNSIDSRIDRLRKSMSEKDIDYYIIQTSDPHGSEYIDDHYKIREYFTGFSGSMGTLVVSMTDAALFVDGRYHIQADEQTEGTCIDVYKLGIKGVPDFITYISDRASEQDTVAIDGHLLMQDDYIKMKNRIKASIDIEQDIVSEIIDNRPEATCKEVFILNDNISGENVAEKLEKIRKCINAKKADGLLISSLDDICYTFNIRGSDIAYNTVAYSYAYITIDSATLYLKDGSFSYDFSEALFKSEVYISDYNDIELELAKLKGKTILLDSEYTSAYFYKIASLGNDIKHVKNYEIIKKHVKNQTEQKLSRYYHEIDAVKVIEFIVKIKALISEGADISEYEAAKMLDKMRAEDADFFDLSFETISAYAENAAVVHYSPDSLNSKKLSNKGFLLVDSGAHYTGATTDITRTIALGELSDKEKRAYTLVLKGNLKLMDAVFIKGTRCENLDILAREPLWKEGLDYRHGTGHGVGAFLNVHEGPYRIGYKIRVDMPQPEIEPGMIISDEPGYYEIGEYGIRLETQLLCVNKEITEYGEFYGFEPLSLVPFEKEAIDFNMLTSEEMNILKRYSVLIRDRIINRLTDRAKIWLIEETDYVDENS